MEKEQNPNCLSEVRTLDRAKRFSDEDLDLYTNNFCKENFIERFLYGVVYRGFMEGREVTVKVWVEMESPFAPIEENENRLRNEVYLLKHPKFESHPNLVKLIGYCFGGRHIGVIYDLNSLDTVENLIRKGSLSWLQRINIALKFACLVSFFHTKDPPYGYGPHLIRNISADHMMLDKDYNLKYYDFSLLSGGIFPDETECPPCSARGCDSYIDPHMYFPDPGTWSKAVDTFAYGIVLMMLISNRVSFIEGYKDPTVYYIWEWACIEYESNKSISCFGREECSLVHKSLVGDSFFKPCDGREITKIAMQCLKEHRYDRPTMDDVVKSLLKLRVVRLYSKALGVDEMLNGHDANYLSKYFKIKF